MNENVIPFAKYHGTGNDFVIINHLIEQYIDPNDHALIAAICHRRFGIGADGLMIIEKPDARNLDFKMLYYNSDGKPSSMCGNGGRCISSAFLDFQTKTKSNNINFSFSNDIYKSEYLPERGWIQLQMQNVNSIQADGRNFILDTGSPHYVQFRHDIEKLDVKLEGSSIRYSETFKSEGINVNFCQWNGNELLVKTYERGVEDETYSCGTGVVASSIAFAVDQNIEDGKIIVPLLTKGGKLSVSFLKDGQKFSEIKLIGPAVKICDGQYYSKSASASL